VATGLLRFLRERVRVGERSRGDCQFILRSIGEEIARPLQRAVVIDKNDVNCLLRLGFVYGQCPPYCWDD
jgi:hypothetical protein